MYFGSNNQKNEGKHENGTYVNIQFSDDTKERLVRFMQLNKIPNPVEKDDLHSTLLVSSKPLHYSGSREIHWKATPISIEKTKTRTGDDAIVISYHCPEQIQRHQELLKTHQTEHSFPDYYVHVTLSYASRGFDLSHIKGFKELGSLIINKEITTENVLIDNKVPMNTAPVRTHKEKRRSACGCP